MRRIVDGFQSLVAAVVAACVGFAPVWFSHLAISGGLAPSWGYAILVLLALITGIMVLAFLRKAGAGIAPLRERRRG